MKKTLVVFANSVKHGKHCVAGKDIQTGNWIRPVSNATGAELDDEQCRCVNPHGKFLVKPLQKVEIELLAHYPLLNQPENFLVDNAEWKQRYNIEAHEVNKYLDSPDTLWGEGNKVVFSHIESGAVKIEQSLYLVKVDNLEIYKKIDNKRRVSFSYKGSRYDLPVTDPNFDHHLNNPQHQNILCVSLGEKYLPKGGENYSCYKIVASII